MRVMADNDVGGAMQVLRRILESPNHAAWLEFLSVAFTDFESLGLSRDAADRIVWQTCRTADVVPITGNRSGGSSKGSELIPTLAYSCEA